MAADGTHGSLTHFGRLVPTSSGFFSSLRRSIPWLKAPSKSTDHNARPSSPGFIHVSGWSKQQHEVFLSRKRDAIAKFEKLKKGHADRSDRTAVPSTSTLARSHKASALSLAADRDVPQRGISTTVKLRSFSSLGKKTKTWPDSAGDAFEVYHMVDDILNDLEDITDLLEHIVVDDQPSDGVEAVLTGQQRSEAAVQSKEVDSVSDDGKQSSHALSNEPAILTEYYNTAAEIKLLYDRLINLASRYSAEKTSRNLLTDQEVSLPTSDDEFEESYRLEQEALDAKLKDALEKANLLREQCNENGYRIEIPEDVDAVSTDDHLYAATTHTTELGAETSSAAAVSPTSEPRDMRLLLSSGNDAEPSPGSVPEEPQSDISAWITNVSAGGVSGDEASESLSGLTDHTKPSPISTRSGQT